MHRSIADGRGEGGPDQSFLEGSGLCDRSSIVLGTSLGDLIVFLGTGSHAVVSKSIQRDKCAIGASNDANDGKEKKIE